MPRLTLQTDRMMQGFMYMLECQQNNTDAETTTVSSLPTHMLDVSNKITHNRSTTRTFWGEVLSASIHSPRGPNYSQQGSKLP